MKLIDFAPHWISFPIVADNVKFFYGISFLCPHCEHSPCPMCGQQRGKRIAVSFWPPIDPDGWESKITPINHDKFHKRIAGEKFVTLSLLPSIAIEGHWHGHITNGEILP